MLLILRNNIFDLIIRGQILDMTVQINVPRFFMVYLYFYKKMKEFSRPIFLLFIFTDFPHFQGPMRAVYQSVGKCLRLHLGAASTCTCIYKISGGLGGPLTPRRFFGARMAPRPIS